MDSNSEILADSGPISARGLLKKALLQRLQGLKVDEGLIPGVMRSLKGVYRHDNSLSTYEVNHRLKFLGWSDIELDHYTWQLAVDFFVEGRDAGKGRTRN